jgi:signal transduction histidine kinase
VTLSITSRVTITHAVLISCVLLPAGFLVYSMTVERSAAERREAADLAAHDAAQEFFGKLSKDILLEFDKGCRWTGIELGARDWALARGDGTVVESGGLFTALDPQTLRGAMRTGVLDAVAGAQAVGRVRIPKLDTEAFAELSESIRSALAEDAARGSFIRAKQTSSHGRRAYEVSFVSNGRRIEIESLEDGSIIDREEDLLPGELPEDLVSLLSLRSAGVRPRLCQWTACAGEILAVVETERDGHHVRIAVNRYGEEYSFPIERPEPSEKSALWLVSAVDASSVQSTARFLFVALAAGMPVVWILSVSIGYFVVRRAFDPVREILLAARRIDTNRLDERLPSGPVRDELASIAETVNAMLDRIEAGFEREKRFTGDASHELRAPLAKMVAEIELALRSARSSEEYSKVLGRCRDYARSLELVLEALLLLARLDAGRGTISLETLDLGDVVVETVRRFDKSDAERVEIDLGSDREPVRVQGDARLLALAVRNLVENALRHGAADAPVRVSVRRSLRQAVVSVEDRGPGIPESERERIFDRFHRLDGSRSRENGGAGLGLPLARSIARAHGGDVRILGKESGGTEVHLTLPVAANDAEPRSPLLHQSSDGTSEERIRAST